MVSRIVSQTRQDADLRLAAALYRVAGGTVRRTRSYAYIPIGCPPSHAVVSLLECAQPLLQPK